MEYLAVISLHAAEGRLWVVSCLSGPEFTHNPPTGGLRPKGDGQHKQKRPRRDCY
jgi:hypothetical protein